MKLDILKKKLSDEIFSAVQVDKLSSDMFPIKNILKQGHVLSPLLLKFVLQYAIRRVRVKQDGSKLNGTYPVVVYADYFNILGGNVHTVKENAEVLVVASKETALKVNADKTKYIVMSRGQNAR